MCPLQSKCADPHHSAYIETMPERSLDIEGQFERSTDFPVVFSYFSLWYLSSNIDINNKIVNMNNKDTAKWENKLMGGVNFPRLKLLWPTSIGGPNQVSIGMNLVAGYANCRIDSRSRAAQCNGLLASSGCSNRALNRGDLQKQYSWIDEAIPQISRFLYTALVCKRSPKSA